VQLEATLVEHTKLKDEDLKARTKAPRILFAIVAIAFLIRLAFIPFTIGDILEPSRDHWHFGCEEGRIARSIAAGDGFGSPLIVPSGPTALTNPTYPYLVAGVFKIFGIYTPASAWVVLGLNGLFSALTCIPIYFVTRRIFSASAALWAAWLWCLFPYAIFLSDARVWEFCLNALLLSLVLWATFAIADESSTWRWIGYGLLWGFAALTNAAILSTLPLLLAWIIWKRHKRGLEWRWRAAATIVVLIATVSPWFIRNYKTFGRFMPFRDNFWLEFAIGNTGDTSDIVPNWAHPSTNPALMERFRAEGEIAFMEEQRRQGIKILRENPWLFLKLTVKRVVYVWVGYWSLRPGYLSQEPTEVPNILFCTVLTVLAIAGFWRAFRTDPAIREDLIPFLVIPLMYPSVYYITHPVMGYRHPMDPVLVVLIGYLGCELAGRRVQTPVLEQARQP
jgi:4-amino-4-deoxy-L-arabinose transferase-like glycosyltransferase